MGHSELLDRLELHDYTLGNNETFLTFFVTCSDDVIDFKNLRQRILNAFRHTQAVKAETEKQKVLIDQQSRKKLSIKFFEAEQTNRYEQRLSELNLGDFSLTEQIKREADLLFDCYKQRVLVILDELDRVGDTRGLASFLKTMSGEQLKFILVGIAQSLSFSDLGLDHRSVERNLWPVRVPRMTPAELEEIVDRALDNLRERGYNYSFTDSARSDLVKAAGGFPWFVHIIGQSALMAARDTQQTEVTSELLKDAIKGLAINRFAQQYQESYQIAVRDSFHREIVLRSFAHWGFTDIPTSDVYAIARKLGVSNPSQYKRHLTSTHYGAPLIAPAFQKQGVVRFRDEMFKQYTKLAPSFYTDADSKVRQAYENYP